MFTGYVAAGTTGSVANYALEAIGTCVIAGTSLMGGEIIDALVGLLIIASLQNVMSVMNMPIFWQFIIRGGRCSSWRYMSMSCPKKRA